MKIIISETQLKLIVESQSLVNSLLDKINRSGKSELTSDELKYLNQYSNDNVDKDLEKWLLSKEDNTFDDEGNKLQYDEFDDYENIFINKNKLKRIIKKFLGKPFTNNADWGGYLVWPISDNRFEGLFLLLSDDSVELLERELIDDEYDDNILMSAENGKEFYKIIMKIKNATT